MAAIVTAWAGWYSGSAVLRTILGFVHVGSLLVAGGHAVVADRLTLFVRRADPATRQTQLAALARTHRIVVAGLALIVLSGVLLLAANLDTYLYSKLFWLKIAVVLLLLGNGVFVVRAGRRAAAAAESPTVGYVIMLFR